MTITEEQRMIYQQLADREGRCEQQIAVDKYRLLTDRLKELREQDARVATQPMPDDGLNKAIRKIGAAYPRDMQMNQYGLVEPEKIFAETLKWHLAAAKVFEYCQAQLHMDLFKDDPEATQIFRQIMVKGFQALQSEANLHGRY
jgi:hypothetical protein